MEYAKVQAGLVVQVIVADQDAVDLRADGPWVLTPFKVAPGYSYDGTTFTAPYVPPHAPDTH